MLILIFRMVANRRCPPGISLDREHGTVDAPTLETLTRMCEDIRVKDADVLPSDASEEEQLDWHDGQQFAALVATLRCTDKQHVLRSEFKDTPEGCYDALWSRVELMRGRAARADQRRAERLAMRQRTDASTQDLQADTLRDQRETQGPDDFFCKPQRLPKNHAMATEHAEQVLEDRMRLALELHYDRVFQEECLARAVKDEIEGDVGLRRRGLGRV